MENNIPIIFTPDNEPYLGRELLYQFDQIITSCLKINENVARLTHNIKFSDHQNAASILIPQSISLILSLRELIRQGYLLGAKTLVRPIIERGAILLYLHLIPSEIILWNEGWIYGKAPGLVTMMKKIVGSIDSQKEFDFKNITADFNAIIHGAPDSALYSTVPMSDGRPGFTSSKSLNVPELCDSICADIIPWITIIQSMMIAYFPE